MGLPVLWSNFLKCKGALHMAILHIFTSRLTCILIVTVPSWCIRSAGTESLAFRMRGLLYFLAIVGVSLAQENYTSQALKAPIPSTTSEPLFSVAGGGAYPTCKATTVTSWKDKPAYTLTVTKPGPKETITTTCYETKTKTDTKTYTSTTTCTVVSSPFIRSLGRKT